MHLVPITIPGAPIITLRSLFIPQTTYYTQKLHKNLNNTTQLLDSINFIYKLTWILLIEVYLWNKFLDNANIEPAVFTLINSWFLLNYVLFEIGLL